MNRSVAVDFLHYVLLVLLGASFARAQDDFHGGCLFEPEQADRAEERIRQNPADLISRAQLIDFHYCKGNLGHSAASPAAHLRHVHWFIENHPERELLSFAEASLDPGYNSWASIEGFQDSKRLWLSVIEKHPDNAAILFNAAHCCLYSDKRTSIELLQRALALEPENAKVASLLGRTLAMAVWGIGKNENGEFAVPETLTQEDRDLAQLASAEVDFSRNPNTVGVAGSTLWRYFQRGKNLLSTKEEAFALAKMWLEKAQALDPGNPIREDAIRDFRFANGDPSAYPPPPSLSEVMAGYQRSLQQMKDDPLPRFEDFVVAEIYRGQPARPAVELGTDENPLNDRFLYSLFDGYEQGPNLAGRYRIFTWSCGTSCLSAGVLDSSTGETYGTPFVGFSYSSFYSLGVEDRNFEPLNYRLTSSLVIATGCPREANCGTYVYSWDGKTFELLRSVILDPQPHRP